jgi:hypothetical protein
MFPSGQKLLTNLRTAFQFLIATNGPQSIALMANGGTFVLDGATPVVVPNTNVTADAAIFIYMLTPAGTVGAQPVVTDKDAGEDFTVVGTALDTSTYGYLILG